MIKVVVNYDPSTGMISHLDGAYVGTGAIGQGLTPYSDADDKPKLSSINSLKESGFTAEEIIEMRKAGLI